MAKKAQTQTGHRAIAAIFADAAREIEEEAGLDAFHAADPNIPRDGMKAGEWEGYPDSKLPPKCPVKVVGRSADGGEYFFITATGHFRTVSKWDGRTLTDLFAPYTNSVKFYWPAPGKRKMIDAETGELVEKPWIKRPERDQAFDCLMNAAAVKGDFDPNKQHRGRGGWEDEQGRFVWHSGGWLWTVDGRRLERARPAQHEGFLYTRQPSTIEPWAESVSTAESPALRIFKYFQTWEFERSYLDPVLLIGWIGVALMGGALKARPVVFTTGGAGTGKTTLQALIGRVLGGVATTSVNTTAAGIYQRAKMDSLPFMIDELESKAGSTRADNVIELIRVAYTGGDISRGGQDHEATTFTARQAFFCSAINAPPMNAQDKTRMAILNLGRLDRPNGIGKMEVNPDTDGRMMLRQVMDGWRDFQERLLPHYWDELSRHGLDSRAIDTFGTLLAAAEMLVGAEAMEECGLPMGDLGHLGEIVAAATHLERLENLTNWHKCLDLLFQASIEAWRDGVRPTVGGVCENLRIGTWDATGARERLQLVGLGAVDAGKMGGECGPCLAVPADGPILQRIFGDTEFHKGVWYTALKQAPKGIVLRDRGNAQKVKINGSTKHCLMVDLAAFDAWAAKQD